MQKNGTHEGDREKATSVLSNFQMPSKRLTALLHKKPPPKEKFLELEPEVLIQLGQQPKNDMLPIIVSKKNDDKQQIIKKLT